MAVYDIRVETDEEFNMRQAYSLSEAGQATEYETSICSMATRMVQLWLPQA